MKTFLDSGVLLTAWRGLISRQADSARSIMAHDGRKFFTSENVKLEVLPKPAFEKRQSEVDFYNDYFKAATIEPFSAELADAALALAKKYGLAAGDALNLASANDLDLRVISPSGATNFPWVLNPDLTNRTAAARSAAATTGDDTRNNVEQIYIANPTTNGTYTVQVTHKGTLTNQWVSILIAGNVAQQPPPLKFNTIIQTGTNQIALGWPAVVGQRYQIQASTNLATTNWQNIGAEVSARLTNVVVQVSKTNSQAFYRLIQLP